MTDHHEKLNVQVTIDLWSLIEEVIRLREEIRQLRHELAEAHFKQTADSGKKKSDVGL